MFASMCRSSRRLLRRSTLSTTTTTKTTSVLLPRARMVASHRNCSFAEKLRDKVCKRVVMNRWGDDDIHSEMFKIAK